MPSILAANALTTLAAVLDDIGAPSDDGLAGDQRVERYINEASDLITQHCGRVFHRSDAIIEKVKSNGRQTIRLSRVPIVAITSIAISETTVTATEYFVDDPADAPVPSGKVYRSAGWPWTGQRRPGLTQGLIPGSEDRSQIVATYNGGWVTPAQVASAAFATRTLPFDVEGVCIRLAASAWRGRGTDRRVASEAGQNASVSYVGAIPPELVQILNPYRRFAHA